MENEPIRPKLASLELLRVRGRRDHCSRNSMQRGCSAAFGSSGDGVACLGRRRRRSIKWPRLSGLSQAAQAPSAGQPEGGLSPLAQPTLSMDGCSSEDADRWAQGLQKRVILTF